MRRAFPFLLLLLAPACGSTEHVDQNGSAIITEPLYDSAIAKSTHNAFERSEALIDQLVYHRIRSLELDIHTSNDGSSAPARDWFVFHEDLPFMRATSCRLLSDCLGQLAAFHRALPEHEVVTVFLDLKSGFGSGHQPADLDAAITKALGRENVVTPSDLIARCPGAETVRDAVTRGTCRFPSLRLLRGKFFVATTGGNACDGGTNVSRYGGSDPRARTAFMAPNVSGDCPIETYDTRRNIVFFNMPSADEDQAPDIRRRGLIPRVYGGVFGSALDDADAFESARAAGALHLATNKVNFEADDWSATHSSRGFPFECPGCADLVEQGALLGVDATSGDQAGTSDSAVFGLTEDDDAANDTWTALASVPSSHVEPLAKACLVARASRAANAASIAICRTFDAKPRVQVRAQNGGNTTITEAPSFAGLSGDSPAFLRLAIAGNEVTALTSSDGTTWKPAVRTTINVPLRFRGVSVSSKGDDRVKALFANLTRERNGQLSTVTAARLERVAVGATGDIFDGAFTP